MQFQVMGPVEIRRDDQVEVLTGRLRRTLLSVLLVRANQPVPVDVLTDALWGDQSDPRAAQKLQLHIHRLRALLDDPDRLTFGPAGYRLRAAPDEIDAEQFDARVTAAAGLAPQQAVESLRAALALWRGAPFADMDLPVLADWARRLTDRRLVAIEALYQAELDCGLHEAVIGDLTELVAQHPLRERLHGLLMTALYRAGRQPDALDAYQQARRTLVAELGIEPGQELRELHRRVLAGDLEGPVARREVPAQLPVDVRGFTGRDSELTELDRLLAEDTPVVISAVAGTAGVGKTALAVHWAHRVRGRFPDGQLYVDLRGYGPDEPVSAADALAGFLRALGLDGAAIPEDLAERAARFRSLVGQRRMLILLDNARTTEQVRPLLAASYTLITSRDSLAGLVAREGAHRIGLDRLPGADAVGLLRELLGARADTEPAAVEALVERCARLPLALRIAAEIVRSRPGRAIGDLSDELAEHGTLDLLDADGDPHTAVRAVFSWSYRQLDSTTARVFRLLGTHPGHDTDAYAVAALAGATLRETRRALDALTRAHLVEQTPERRYQPHDLLRTYAAELAKTTDDPGPPRTRLRDYYLATASAAMDVIAPHEAGRRPKVAAPGLEQPVFDNYRTAFRWLDAERTNLLTVTQHAEPDQVIAMSDTVWRYLTVGGYHDDALALHTHALAAAQDIGDVAAEANVRRVLGSTLVRIGLVSKSIEHLERAIVLYRQLGNRSMEASALNNIGVAHWQRGDISEAADKFRTALTLHRPGGDERLHVPVTNNLARVLCTLGRYDEATSLFKRSVDIAGDRPGLASALGGLAEVGAATGRYAEALDDAEQALAVARDAGHRGLECTALRVLGVANHGLGEHGQAISHLDSALRIARAVGETDEIMATLNGLAAAHASTGDVAEALRLYQETLTIDNGRGHRDLYAHALAGIGDVHDGLGEHDQARGYWQQALEIYRELGMPHAEDVAGRADRLERSRPTRDARRGSGRTAR